MTTLCRRRHALHVIQVMIDAISVQEHGRSGVYGTTVIEPLNVGDFFPEQACNAILLIADRTLSTK